MVMTHHDDNVNVILKIIMMIFTSTCAMIFHIWLKTLCVKEISYLNFMTNDQARSERCN